MYTSLHIKGFRCFRDLEIPKLARINLIGGKNNTGKTALLEAVRVGTAGPAEPVSVFNGLFRHRGLKGGAVGAVGHRALLFGFGAEEEVDIRLTHAEGPTASA